MANFKTKINKAKYFILGMIVMAVIFTLILQVSAATTRTATLIYDNVKVNIDGRAVVLTDLEGRTIEPVFINDTLYVPMSPMARAFGKKSVYEGGNSKTLYITTPIYTADSSVEGVKLSDMTKDSGYSFNYDKEVRANSGNYVYNCLYRSMGYNLDTESIDYFLNGQYKSVKGNIYVNWDYRSSAGKVQIRFYGDGKLLYGSKEITGDIDLTNFEVDLNGVKVLKIVFEKINQGNITLGLSDTILYKYK